MQDRQGNIRSDEQNDETLRQAKGKNVYVVENLIPYRVKENNHDGAPSKQLTIPTALYKERGNGSGSRFKEEWTFWD